MPGASSGVALRDHAWIAGDGCGALVDRSGTVDWYCPGGLDESAAFFSLLDPAGGALTIRPAGGAPVDQRYLPDTLIARTELVSAQGRIRIEDVATAGRLVRIVTALAGPVDVEILVTHDGARGWSEGVAFGRVVVRAGIPFSPADRGPTARWRAATRLPGGDRLVVTVDGADNRHHRPLGADQALRLVEDAATASRFWAARCTYDGPYAEAVRRSLLLVKGLTGASGGGGLAAAGTASVGRVAGGERNRDSRLAWVRHVAGAAGVWRATGYDDEGQAAEQWLREVASDSEVPFPAVRALAGGPPADPAVLDLAGWRHSQPVRVGFEPPRRPDLDLYGDLVAAISGRPVERAPADFAAALGAAAAAAGPAAAGQGRTLDYSNAGPLWGAWPALVAGADWIADHWQEADCGIWGSANPAGPDTPRRPYTASRLQARFALERLARLARSVNPLDLDAVGWQQAVHAIDRWLETHAATRSGALLAFGGSGGSRSGSGGSGSGGSGSGAASGPGAEGSGSSAGGSRGSGSGGSGSGSGGLSADGALLRVAWRGPWPASHPRVAETVDAVLDQLGNGSFVYRYPPATDDGLPGNDNADLEVSAWAVRALAVCGRWDEAHERLERLVELPSATGILTDAVDPATAELLGDLPSAGAHLALVEAALALRAGPR